MVLRYFRYCPWCAEELTRIPIYDTVEAGGAPVMLDAPSVIQLCCRVHGVICEENPETGEAVFIQKENVSVTA